MGEGAYSIIRCLLKEHNLNVPQELCLEHFYILTFTPRKWFKTIFWSSMKQWWRHFISFVLFQKSSYLSEGSSSLDRTDTPTISSQIVCRFSPRDRVLWHFLYSSQLVLPLFRTYLGNNIVRMSWILLLCHLEDAILQQASLSSGYCDLI